MINPLYQELVGDREVLGKPVHVAIPEAAEQGFIEILDGVYRSGKPHIGSATPLQLARTPAQALEVRYLDFIYQPRRDEDSNVSGIIVFGVDVTERKRVEQVLLQSEKLNAVGRLASSVAHEINNPLEAVTNLIYLAQQTATAPDTKHYLSTAEVELRRVSAIANQTLRFYRQSTKPIPVMYHKLIDVTLPLYQGRFLNSGVSVQLRHRSKRTVTCFDGEIRQVVSNLVANAIDAMRSNGGRLIVRSRNGSNWKTGKEGAVLTIADTGAGMSSQTLARVFEPFFTTKGHRGTGLGLWISREIINRHGGVLKVRSSQRLGHSGTVFTLFLPCENEAPAA